MHVIKYSILLVVIGIFSINIYAQNLIINGSFEDLYGCPNNVNQLNIARPWKNVAYGSLIGTPDLFSGCTSSGMGVPNNGVGFQYARTGISYAGLIAYSNIAIVREYMYDELLISLDSGKRYKLKFYVNLANYSAYAIDCLGAYISDTPMVWNSRQPIPVSPQVKSIQNFFLRDTLRWMLIEGDYIAKGGEQYITFGNFKNDDSTRIILVTDPMNASAYYYFDDISLYEYTDPLIPVDAGKNTTICLGESTQIGSPATNNYKYRWSPAENISDTAAAQPIVTPNHTTTYYLTQWDYMENETHDSVTIYVYNCSGAEAGGNRAVCKGDSTRIGSNNYAYNRYSWHPAAGLSDTTSGMPWASPKVTTVYYLTQHNMQDSVSHDSVLVKVIDCNSVNDNRVIIYPNPSQGEFYIEFSNYVPEDTRFTFSNTLGQVLIKSDIMREERKKLVNTSTLASGVYFCRVYLGDEMLKSEKIVKISH